MRWSNYAFNELLTLIGSLLAVLVTALFAFVIFGGRDYKLVGGEQTSYMAPTPIRFVNEVNPVERVTIFEEESIKAVEEATIQAEIAKNTPPVELTIEERIEAACNAHGIPFDIVLAIARLETGWFTSNAYINNNNPGGLSVNETPIHFDTIDEGVDAFVSNLANNYFAIGLDTPEEIGGKYCPVNPEWAGMVYALMEG